MAESAIKYDVTCGVLEEDKKKVVLMYEVDDPANRITWEWKKEGSCYVAELIAQDSKRGHRSQPVPDDIYKQLGSPSKKRVDIFYKVKMSRPKEVSIEKYFAGQ